MSEIVELVSLFFMVGLLYAIVFIAERNRIDKDE
jgi:hypothetical protein